MMNTPIYDSMESQHPQISPEDLAILQDPFAVIPTTKDASEESEAK